MMATPMSPDWSPPPEHLRSARRSTATACWRQWADGRWWALTPGVDIPDVPTVRNYRNAAQWGGDHGYSCSHHRDPATGTLYLRFTPRTTDQKEAA